MMLISHHQPKRQEKGRANPIMTMSGSCLCHLATLRPQLFLSFLVFFSSFSRHLKPRPCSPLILRRDERPSVTKLDGGCINSNQASHQIQGVKLDEIGLDPTIPVSVPPVHMIGMILSSPYDTVSYPRLASPQGARLREAWHPTSPPLSLSLSLSLVLSYSSTSNSL